MKKPENPFSINAYHGKDYFCNRENDLRTLHDHIENDRNVVLFGWRRMGKSALIHRFFEDLESSGEYETLYVDFLATHSLGEALKTFTTSVYDRFGITKKGITSTIQNLLSSLGATLTFNPMSGTPEINLGIRRPERSEYTLNVLGEFLRKRKKRVVLAIDEFQQISSYQKQNAEAVFRTWAQLFPDIRIIYCGSHRTLMAEMFSEKSRPFYHSAMLQTLDPIPLDNYVPFIQKHFESKKKKIEKELIEKIYSWARGQTYTVQLACNYLFSQYTIVKEENVETVFDNILMQYQAVFANFAKILTINQWNVLKSISKEEPLNNPLSRDFIDKYQLGATSTVSSAIKALVRQEMVIIDEGAYLVHDVILARWMARL